MAVKIALGRRVGRSTKGAEMLLSYDRSRKDYFSAFVLGREVKLGQSRWERPNYVTKWQAASTQTVKASGHYPCANRILGPEKTCTNFQGAHLPYFSKCFPYFSHVSKACGCSFSK